MKEYLQVYYLVGDQLEQSDFLQKMKRTLPQWENLLGKTIPPLENKYSYLKLIGQLAEDFNYFWKFIPEEECNPQTNIKRYNKRWDKYIPIRLRESLFEKVRQDNKREFNKWKRELDGTMPRNYKGKKITLDSFLWDKLNNGSEITDFNKTTRDYILTFPHIIVKDFRPRTEQTQETIN